MNKKNELIEEINEMAQYHVINGKGVYIVFKKGLIKTIDQIFKDE